MLINSVSETTNIDVQDIKMKGIIILKFQLTIPYIFIGGALKTM